MIDNIKKTVLYKLYRTAKNKRATLRSSKIFMELRRPFIEQYLPKNGIGAELGVFKGVFSSVLLETTKPKKLHLIDPWYFLSTEWSWSNELRSTVDTVLNILKKD